jgi:hypothetical protein
MAGISCRNEGAVGRAFVSLPPQLLPTGFGQRAQSTAVTEIEADTLVRHPQQVPLANLDQISSADSSPEICPSTLSRGKFLERTAMDGYGRVGDIEKRLPRRGENSRAKVRRLAAVGATSPAALGRAATATPSDSLPHS